MTIKELSKYHNLKVELLQLEDNIKEIESTIIGASKITDTSFNKSFNNGSPTERISIKLTKLKDKVNDKKEELLNEFWKIEQFLNTVDDNEIRIIIRKRFLESKTWQKVADEMAPSSDRTTPYYQLKKYLKTHREEKKKCQY